MELAGGIGGFTLLGYWLDLKLGTYPRWLTVGAVLGCVGGMYNLIKIGISESKRAQALSSKMPTDRVCGEQSGETENNAKDDGDTH